MQVNRLFQIVYLLMERGNVTAKELAKRFEVTQRTIYRDIDALSAAIAHDAQCAREYLEKAGETE